MNDLANRAILLTPAGAAAIAVIRVVGPAVSAFLAASFSRPPKLGRAVHGDLRDGDRVIDDPVVVLVRPDAADVNLHGGPWVVRATLDLLARWGFEVVATQSLPLPAEAVDADELIEREVLQYLPLARTELAVRVLLAQPAAWRRWLASNPSAADVQAVLADRAMDRLLSPPRVAIVGAANVGKSTLANRLFGQERSITADVPGTTRDWVGELADLGGVAVTLVDTPGQRATDDPVERQAIARAGPQIAAADVVVVVLDGSRALDDEQRAVLDAHPHAVVVRNKADLAARWGEADLGAATDATRVVPVVATTGTGTADLISLVSRRLGCDRVDVEAARCWTSRQDALLRALVTRRAPVTPDDRMR